MMHEVDLTDLPPLRAYGTYTRAPEVKRGIPKGVWWVGAFSLSMVLWGCVIWVVYGLTVSA